MINMRGSVAYSFKGLMSKIHPPLSLNPRESQKLIGLLKTSHKKQLDERHPKSSSGHFEATDAHFHALLSSPLFHNVPHNVATPAQVTSTQRLNSFESARFTVNRVVRNFERNVAAGTMTLRELRVMSSTLIQSTEQVSLKERTTLVESTQATEKIIHWLWASGAEQSREFLEDSNFPKLLGPLLTGKTHERFLWTWINNINQLIKETKILSDNTIRVQCELAQAYLVERVIKRRMLFGNGIADACEAFLDIFNKSSQDMDVNWRRRIRRAGTYLVRSLCSKDKVPKIDVGLFDAFVASCDHWSHPDLFRAMLSLHHPQGPRPEHAVQFLHQLESHAIKDASQVKRYDILRLALETAKIMLEQQRISECKMAYESCQRAFS